MPRRNHHPFPQLGIKVRKKRERLKMSQGDLAALAGVTRPMITMIEAGQTRVSLDLLRNLMTALGCKASDLL